MTGKSMKMGRVSLLSEMFPNWDINTPLNAKHISYTWVKYSSVQDFIEDKLDYEPKAAHEIDKQNPRIDEIYQKYQLWSLDLDQYPVKQDDFEAEIKRWYLAQQEDVQDYQHLTMRY